MRTVTSWQAPIGDGKTREEIALQFRQDRPTRLLVLPPLFDEGNKLRHQLVEVMRRLDLSGIDSVLPDLPGQNESLLTPEKLTLAMLENAAADAAQHFGATHCLSVRNSACFAPVELPGWSYAPVSGSSAIRSLMRARSIAAKEAGREEALSNIEAQARDGGTELAGWKLSAQFFAEMMDAQPRAAEAHTEIRQEEIGGKPLWLRAEPDDDPDQADALAAIIAVGMLET
ncbi:hypothetical protein [Erythrobacter sp. HKB08]|uniref:hypothetical protein n=1 Tax=Erythrobacter sp. HKB08 TaxID=2502843 RepID=UPI001008DEF2|nr:hypothetical protein [Erythrobacter sp. HKB08]